MVRITGGVLCLFRFSCLKADIEMSYTLAIGVIVSIEHLDDILIL